MTKSGLSKSVRKFIRSEKARIRAQFLDFKKQEEMISQLYGKLSDQPIIDKKEKEKIRQENKQEMKVETKKPKFREKKVVKTKPKSKKHEK